MPGLGQGLGDPVLKFSSPLRGGLRWGLHILILNILLLRPPSRLPLRGGGIKGGKPGMTEKGLIQRSHIIKI
jgi:hypothetical protein